MTTARSLRVVALIGLVGIAATVAIVLRPYFLPSGPTDYADHPAVGRALPQIDLLPLTGEATGPGEPIGPENLSGKVVVLNFWATWCGPCVVELPDVAAIEQEFRNRPDFRFLAVSCNVATENVDQLRSDTAALLRKMDLDLPTYTDPDGLTRKALDDAAGFEGYPTTILLDRTGTIRGVCVGAVTRETLHRQILQLLNETPT